jgi:phosphate transport system protein
MSQEKFHDELNALKKDVIDMGVLARDMLVKSVKALKDRDTALAEWVVANKKTINDLDDKIEEGALKLLTLHSPMAGDMRTIACILKANTYLARIGLYGKDIAKIALELAEQPHISKLVSIPHMADIVRGMIDDTLKAFETGDMSKIRDMRERDDNVDALRYSVFRECLTYMMEDPKTITRCANYMMVVRYLERCGDHACKMAEKVHYMQTGERIDLN